MAGKAQFVVTTVTGSKTVHEYDVPDDLNGAIQFLRSINQPWALAFAGSVQMVPMQNPLVFYRIEHVVSLEMRFVGREDLESEIRRIGFPIPPAQTTPNP